jgi:hypothetical protein
MVSENEVFNFQVISLRTNLLSLEFPMGKSVDMEVSQLLPWGTGINLEDNSTRWEKSGSLKNCGVHLHFDAESFTSRPFGEKESERGKKHFYFT